MDKRNVKPILFGEFDYLIVGGGSAGCLLANRLSANPETKVLLLEAGGNASWHWFHIPIGYVHCIGNPRADWCFQTSTEAGLDHRQINYPRGRVIGGSSTINGMIYMRGQRQDYDHWQEQGNTGWGWDEVLPLFKKFENHYLGDGPFHSSQGELRVEQQRLHWPILDAFREACAQQGIAPIEDFNTGDNEGSSYFHVTQKRGTRFSAARAFLHPIKGRKNLHVMLNVLVDDLVIDNHKRVVGLYFMQGYKRFFVGARAEVILSAGAIGSVQILQRSGVGEGAFLQSMGITVQHDAPQVGKNLQDHLQLRSIYKIEQARTLNTMVRSPLQKLWMGIQYAIFKRGPLSMAPSQLGVFTRSGPQYERANLEYHVQPLSLDKFGDPLHSFNAFTAAVCNLRPSSRGQVKISNPYLSGLPLIEPNYLSTVEDQQVAVQSLRLTRQIMGRLGMQPYKPEEYLPGPTLQSETELLQAAGRVGTTIFHPVGTCRMGSDVAAVVAPDLKVKGLIGLRVIDASVMPSITSGNTNAPTMMIAEKGAQLILSRR